MSAFKGYAIFRFLTTEWMTLAHVLFPRCIYMTSFPSPFLFLAILEWIWLRQNWRAACSTVVRLYMYYLSWWYSGLLLDTLRSRSWPNVSSSCSVFSYCVLAGAVGLGLVARKFSYLGHCAVSASSSLLCCHWCIYLGSFLFFASPPAHILWWISHVL